MGSVPPDVDRAMVRRSLDLDRGLRGRQAVRAKVELEWQPGTGVGLFFKSILLLSL